MADFHPIFEFLMKYEGGYVHDPHDAGGETKYGISKRSFPNEDILHLTKERAEVLYRENYWNKLNGDFLQQKVALTLFDFAVNSGVQTVVLELQRALGVVVDGVFGSKTLVKLQDLDEKETKALIDRINDARLQLYLRLGDKPTQRRFLLGWLRRLMAVVKEV